MVGRALTLFCALLPAAVSAYSNTHPILAWSSLNSNALSSLAISKAAKTNAHGIANALYTHDDICDHDAIVVIDHMGLHASDLRALSPSSHLAKALSKAPSSLQLAYVESETRDANPFVDLSGILSKRCGSRVVSHAPGLGDLMIDADNGKHIVAISLPALADGEAGASRKSNFISHESWLSNELSKIEAAFPSNLIIYTGSPASMFHPRQSTTGSSTFDAHINASPSGGSGGILKNYQLLTPGLILALLITLFVLIPVIFLGVSALSSIQSPLTNEIPKGFSAEEKKNQ